MEDSVEVVANKCSQELSECTGPCAVTHYQQTRVVGLVLIAFTPVVSSPDTFQRCILANQSDPSACDTYKASLSRCAANAVPLLGAIKRRCDAQVRAYDLCLEKNAKEGDEAVAQACTPKLRELWQCTEMVKREEMDKEKARIAEAREAKKA